MGSPQRRRPAPPLDCRRLFNCSRNSGEKCDQRRECVCGIELTGWGRRKRIGHFVLRYSHPVHPGFILHFVAQGSEKYPEPCVRVHRDYARRVVGGRSPQVQMRCEGEAKITQRKNGISQK